ncbi:MAG: hypothetical protein J6Y13_09840, partial [Treponema sp.]|nr:hypothetical protein [Treponema sp.]
MENNNQEGEALFLPDAAPVSAGGLESWKRMEQGGSVSRAFACTRWIVGQLALIDNAGRYECKL